MTQSARRDRRAQERRKAKVRRGALDAGGRAGGNPLVTPEIVAVAFIALVLGLRAAGVFDPGPAKINPGDAQFDPAGAVVGVRQADEGRGHVTNDKRVTYKTTPPTSGDHWDTPAPWGSYDRQQPDERTVHNLEHGGIVVSYAAGLPADELKQLTAVVSQLRSTQYRKIVLQPYAALGDAKVALAAWDWLLRLPAVDETQIVRFVRAHYDGPEAPEPGVP